LKSLVDELVHPELALWRANVGAPVALELADALPALPPVIDILSWNLAIGSARLGEVIEQWQDGGLDTRLGATYARDARPPLIVLAQEAYRTDETVPGTCSGSHRGKPLHPTDPEDITAVARCFGMSLRYAPSMRNGAHQSDRGNAILATAALGEAHAFSLPYVHQRRVVVTVQLQNVPDLWFTSAHLDMRGQLNGRWFGAYGRGRSAQAASLCHRLTDLGEDCDHVVGADLNTPFGGRDPAVRALRVCGFSDAQRVGRWRHTLHWPVPLAPDHVLFRSPRDRFRVTVARVDADAADGGRRVFGSDHHPLFARVHVKV
jgi:hypothetical protein